MSMAFDAQGYVSFETALSIHGVLDDCVHAVRIATAGSDRQRRVPGIGLVEWIALPDDLLFGDERGTDLDFPELRVATPEKALCDLLWLCESRGFAPPVHGLRTENLNADRLAELAGRMGVPLALLGTHGT
jgi:hypothetical protein